MQRSWLPGPEAHLSHHIQALVPAAARLPLHRVLHQKEAHLRVEDREASQQGKE